MHADFSSILYAFLLTLGAGISTSIGGIIAISSKKQNKKFLSWSLGFSAGVMIYISMIEILPEAIEYLKLSNGSDYGELIGILAFFGGIFIIAAIDKLVPNEENPHVFQNEKDYCEGIGHHERKRLMKMGSMAALAIFIHNMPEGMATFMSGINNLSHGVAIAIAIAIHNIPEGIAIATPLYYATCDRKYAFKMALFSGLSEPLGAILTYLILLPFLNNTLYGIVFAATAGIMVFISVDELLPAAREYGQEHSSIYGVVLGMMVMAISLLLLAGG